MDKLTVVQIKLSNDQFALKEWEMKDTDDKRLREMAIYFRFLTKEEGFNFYLDYVTQIQEGVIEIKTDLVGVLQLNAVEPS